MSATREKQVYGAKGAQRAEFSFLGSTTCLSWMWVEHHSDMESWAVSDEKANVELGRLGERRWLSLANSSLPPYKV